MAPIGGQRLWQRAPHVAFVDNGSDRVVLLDLRDPRTARPKLLVGPGAVIWRAMDGTYAEGGIVAMVAHAFAVPEGQILGDVPDFLRLLRDEGLAVDVPT